MIPHLLDKISRSFQDFVPGEEAPAGLIPIKVPGKTGARNKVNVLVFGGREERLLAACMFPRSPDADQHVAREAENLLRFHAALKDRSAAPMLPKVLFNGTLEGVRVLMEEGIPGLSFQEVLASGRPYRDTFLTCGVLLAEMHGATETARVEVDKAFLEEWFFQPWLGLADRFSDFTARHGDRVSAWFERAGHAMQGMRVPLIGQHGDFSSFNIRIHGSRIAVIDWEDAVFHHPPFLDMNLFIVSCAHQLEEGMAPAESLMRFALGPGPFRRVVREAASRYCLALDFSPVFLMMTAPACMMQMALRYLEAHRGQEAAARHWLERIACFVDHCEPGECW